MSESATVEDLLKTNPLAAGVMVLFALTILTLMIAFVVTWGIVAQRWYRGIPILPTEHWKPRVWSLADLILVAVAVIVAQTIGIRIWAAATSTDLKQMVAEKDFPLSAMAVGSASFLVVMVAIIIWLNARFGASLEHIGLTLKHFFSRLRLGLFTSAMALPLVFIVMGLVSAGFDQEYEHPLIQRLTADGNATSYLLALFCAVIAAPLFEEFLFRVLLQGWLQSLPWSISSFWWLVGANRQQRSAVYNSANPTEPPQVIRQTDTSAEVDVPPAEFNPYSATTTDMGTAQPLPWESDGSVLTLPENLKPPLWPVFVSGTLFGLAHFDYGLSFIPLILLGIVLGLLYRATHSIWPCFLLHFALNSFSMFALGVSLLSKSVLPAT